MMQIDLPAGAKGRDDIARAFNHLANFVSAAPPGGTDPIAAMRDAMESYGEPSPDRAVDGVEVRATTCAGINAEWLLPTGWRTAPAARLVHLHGGSWAAGSLDSHRQMMSSLAVRLGYPVLMVAYGLAPERPFPAGLEDGARALAWARHNGPDGESTAEHLALSGDSAGGNIAAAVVVRSIGDGGERPDQLLLLSASLELTADPGRRSIPDPLNGYDRQVAAIEGIQALYLQGSAEPEDPLVSPLRATAEVLGGFPATLLQVSDSEFLLWDAQQFCGKLQACGSQAMLSIWPSMPHVWQMFPYLPETAQALDEAAAFLTPADR